MKIELDVKVNSKTAEVFVEKISGAIGGFFLPPQMIRIAKAEAEVERIRAESHIEVTDIHRRALSRFLQEEAKKQSNIEDITQQALPLLDENSSPEKVEDDWITNFFDKCRIVSDEDMQRLWARVIAGEANSPGTFSRKTVNLMADFDRGDADLFTSLCGFCWLIEQRHIVLLVFDAEDEIYHRSGIRYSSLIHLESMGLVQSAGAEAHFLRSPLPKNVATSYFGKPLQLTMPDKANNTLGTGQARLTRAGQELAPICGSKPVEGFFDFVYDRWATIAYVPQRATERSATRESLSPAMLISDLGWSREQALETRMRLRSFEEDWDAPGMEDYDDL